MRINFSNPCVMWILCWILVLMLMSLRLTTNIVELNNRTLALVGINLITALMLLFFTKIKIKNKNLRHILISPLDLLEMRKLLKPLLLFWMLGTVVDIIYSGGVPIVWALLGSGKDYTDFGVHSFHGVVNAAYLFSVTILSVRIFYEKKNCTLFLLVLLCWPIIMLGRGILLSALVQIGAVYIIFNKVNIKKLSIIILVTILVIIIFGVVGDYRGTENPFGYLVGDDFSSKFFNKFPNGFLWFYVYMTAGLNNIAFSIDHINPAYYPHYSIINLFPSYLRLNLDNYVLNASLVELADQNLNTSTFYSGYISDFGLTGAAIAGTALQVISVYFYRKAKRGKLAFVLAYVIMFECIVFSIFYDMFLLLPYLLQITLAFYLMYRCKIAKRKSLLCRV